MKKSFRTPATGRRRAYLTGGTLVGVAALVTAAAFTDSSFLRLNGENGFGGSGSAFAMEVKAGNVTDLTDDGTWAAYSTAEEAGALPIEGADALVPGGDPVTANIPVRNASENLDATITLGLLSETDVEDATASQWAVGADGAPSTAGAANAAYLDALRFDVAVDGTTTATGLTYDEMSATPVPVGEFAGLEAKLVTVDVSLAANGAETQYNGGQAVVLAHFHATS